MSEEHSAPPAVPEPRPPLGSWARLYVLVLLALAADILLLAWLTERFH